jgi:hypothetical protein
MTNLGVALSLTVVPRDRGKAAPLRYPGFPVEVGGFGEVCAAFFRESRIRGFRWFREVGNPGPLRSG